jgi:hypothetical protein
MSYYDGCKWRTRNVSVTANAFSFTPSDIYNAATPPWVGQTGAFAGAFTFDGSQCNVTGSWLDYNDAPPTGNSYECGFNIDEYQPTGGSGGAAPGPYTTNSGANAQMSVSSFNAPLNNLDSTSYGGLGEAPGNVVWSGNNYSSDVSFLAYLQQNNLTPPYDCGSVIGGFQPVCIVNPSQWTSIWQQG